MPDYQKGKIYAIKSYQTEMIYIGSTIQPLSKRLGTHKANYIKNIAISSREILKYEDYYIELVENFPCNTKEELLKREGFHIKENINICVNCGIAGRTKQEYYQDNLNKIKETQKQYYQDNVEQIKQSYQDNKEIISERRKQYYQDNKEIISDRIKQYRQYNVEQIKQSYQDNKEIISERNKQYYQNNVEKIKEYKKQYYQKKKQQQTQPETTQEPTP